MTERTIEPGTVNDKGIVVPDNSLTLEKNKALLEAPIKTPRMKALDDLSQSLAQLTNVMSFLGSIHNGRVNANPEHEVVMRLETTYTQLEAVWAQYLDCMQLVVNDAITDDVVKANMYRQIKTRRHI